MAEKTTKTTKTPIKRRTRSLAKHAKTLPSKPETGRGSKAVDVSTALDLRLNHKLTYQEMSKILGKSKQAIHKQISHLIPSQQTDDFINNRAGILANAQMRLLATGLTPAKLKKISTRDAVVSAGILYDKERLERGQATSITDVRSLILELDAAEARAMSMLASPAIDVTIK